MSNDSETPTEDQVFTIKPETELVFLDLHAILGQALSSLVALEATEELETRVQENCVPLF